MKPWFLIRTPSGRRWHVVDEFHYGPASGRHLVSTICRSESIHPLIPVSRHIDSHDLAPGDVVCSRCAELVRRRAASLTNAAAALAAHTAPSTSPCGVPE